MKEKFEKLDAFLKDLGLKRVENGFGGSKLVIIGIEGVKFDFRLECTYQGHFYIEDFKGSIEFKEFIDILTKITNQIKHLNL